MNIHTNGLLHINEIYNKYDNIILNIIEKKILENNKNIIPIIQKRLENIYTYLHTINEELNELENDIENKDNNNYILNELSHLIKIEDDYKLINKLLINK